LDFIRRRIVVKTENLGVRYADGKQALCRVSFEVKEGENVGIIGANGAGKSTLLKTMVGILLPEEGSIEIDHISVTKKNVRLVREKAGVVFQNPDDQLFMSSVYDDIAFGLRNYGIGEAEIEDKIKGIAHALGMERLLTKNSSRLSGGEQRLVAIATVMVMEPRIVLFDEPTSFLDPRTRRNLIGLLKELPVTKLIATHDLDMALELCDRIIILREGKLFEQGNAGELLSNQDLMEKAGLELPYCLQRKP
jgi:cobalt/nickel transport system ATP-binding protein